MAWETVNNDREDVLTEAILRQEEPEENRQEEDVLVGLELQYPCARGPRRYGPDTEIQYRSQKPHGLAKPSRIL